MVSWLGSQFAGSRCLRFVGLIVINDSDRRIIIALCACTSVCVCVWAVVCVWFTINLFSIRWVSAINNNIIIIFFHRTHYDAFYCWLFIYFLAAFCFRFSVSVFCLIFIIQFPYTLINFPVSPSLSDSLSSSCLCLAVGHFKRFHSPFASNNITIKENFIFPGWKKYEIYFRFPLSLTLSLPLSRSIWLQ